jgi:hypothetical protein
MTAISERTRDMQKKREKEGDKSGQKSFSALENDNGGVHSHMDICHV